MCGRFVQFSSLRTLENHFLIEPYEGDISVNYNIAPTQEILVVKYHEGRRLYKFHWGLIPSWSKNLSVASRLINARAETVSQKPSFRAAFKRRRCVIPADGFYEWKGKKGNKQPYFITSHSDQPLAFAGLWETWKRKDATPEDPIHRSCTIITTAASQSLQDIHHRMPLILKPDALDSWLDPNVQEVNQLNDIMHNQHVREMKSYPVSKFVNRVQNNSKECIEPLPDS